MSKPTPASESGRARADWAPFDVVVFDCDSTLAAVEGIDELARWLGRAAEVEALTAQAMNGEVPLEAVYSRRLELLQPTREQLRRLGQLYRDNTVPGAREVVEALQALRRTVFIVSGGLAEPVREFGAWLGVPAAQIHAVGTDYDQLSGAWWETWKQPRGRNPHERYLGHDGGPLTIGRGKAEIIRRLREAHRGRAMLVGDGTSDLEAREAVDLFVGFGGVVARERVAAAADVFVTSNNLAPVLPLAIARTNVPAPWAAVYAAGVMAIEGGEVVFRSEQAREGLRRRLGRQQADAAAS
jgi:phosphoserine phosphatase